MYCTFMRLILPEFCGLMHIPGMRERGIDLPGIAEGWIVRGDDLTVIANDLQCGDDVALAWTVGTVKVFLSFLYTGVVLVQRGQDGIISLPRTNLLLVLDASGKCERSESGSPLSF
jgi:hypothetical protein